MCEIAFSPFYLSHKWQWWTYKVAPYLLRLAVVLCDAPGCSRQLFTVKKNKKKKLHFIPYFIQHSQWAGMHIVGCLVDTKPAELPAHDAKLLVFNTCVPSSLYFFIKPTCTISATWNRSRKLEFIYFYICYLSSPLPCFPSRKRPCFYLHSIYFFMFIQNR